MTDKSINELDRIQDYRFGSMLKGNNYAFARGLTINPTHLPQALDAMMEDGWYLVAVFGQTNATDIGFIFSRERSTYSPSIEPFIEALAKAQAEVLKLRARVDELLRANNALVDKNRDLRRENDHWTNLHN